MTGVLQTDRDADEYTWLLTQAAALRDRRGVEIEALAGFIEEAAEDMLAKVRSQIVNLLAHATKAAYTRNPQVAGHWRSECVEFHDQLVDVYRPSMRQRIDMDLLWRRATRKVDASFQDHGEDEPMFPLSCPVSLEVLIDPDLNIERLVEWLRPNPETAMPRVSGRRPK